MLNPFGSLLNNLNLLDRSDLVGDSESWPPKQQTTAWWGQSRRPASAARRALRCSVRVGRWLSLVNFSTLAQLPVTG